MAESPFRVHEPPHFPSCPLCGGEMELVYSRFGENVVVCIDCQTGLTIPRKAWDIAKTKRRQQTGKPDEKAG